MNAQQWYILAVFLIVMGIAVLGVSQFVLIRWLKRFKQE